jgi:hypothetical protein
LALLLAALHGRGVARLTERPVRIQHQIQNNTNEPKNKKETTFLWLRKIEVVDPR